MCVCVCVPLVTEQTCVLPQEHAYSCGTKQAGRHGVHVPAASTACHDGDGGRQPCQVQYHGTHRRGASMQMGGARLLEHLAWKAAGRKGRQGRAGVQLRRRPMHIGGGPCKIDSGSVPEKQRRVWRRGSEDRSPCHAMWDGMSALKRRSMRARACAGRAHEQARMVSMHG